MSHSILVPVDGSDPSRAAADYASEQFFGASLTLLYVMDPMSEYSRLRAFPGYRAEDEYKNEREKGEWVLESILEALPEDVIAETDLDAGDPARTILRYADEHDVDGIVIGSHGREGATRVLLGSVAETVVRRAAVPVTVVRAEEPPNG